MVQLMAASCINEQRDISWSSSVFFFPTLGFGLVDKLLHEILLLLCAFLRSLGLGGVAHLRKVRPEG